MGKFYWLKLKNNYFSQPKIKKLRKIAGGDTYTIIYLKMQLLSLENDGKLYFEGIEENFVEEMALTLDEDVDNVAVTVQYLIRQGLIEMVSDEEYKMTETQSLIGSETSSAARVRKCREKQKALQCNTDVTKCNTEIEIEKELEIRDRVDYQQVADLYNNTCVSFPKVKSLSNTRKKAIKARLRTYSIEDFEKLFQKAEESDFLKGKNDRNWSANFDWLIKDSNMAKVLDGNYENKGEKKNITNNSEGRSYEMDDLEKMLLD